jgi:hypothetical protein
MAVHKVPQDVEADDKFLGPLSFKQFVFFGVAAITGYLTFLSLSEGWYLLTPFVFVPFIVSATLAFPWSKEQPTELWLAARIRFFLKPRKRIWDQSGAKELVTITAPKKEVYAMTDGLNQTEVKSRLNALATMIDSRGWAIKNITGAPTSIVESDRLVAPTINAQPTTLAVDETDVMDSDSSTIARQFSEMIEQSEKKQKSKTLELIEQARQQASPNETQSLSTSPTKPQSNSSAQQDFWFMHNQPNPTQQGMAAFTSSTSNVVQPGQPTTTAIPVVAPEPIVVDEEAFLAQAHEKQRRDALQTSSKHEKVILPQGQQVPSSMPPQQVPATPQATQAPQQPVTQTPDPVILDLAKSNDLNIDTLARQAKKKDDGEVVISLR